MTSTRALLWLCLALLLLASSLLSLGCSCGPDPMTGGWECEAHE